MNAKKFNALIARIQQDSRLRPGEKLIICLNRSCSSMLEDVCLLGADGAVRDAFWTTYAGGDQADEAVVRLTEDGDNLVVFHESRPSSRDGRPNGIRIHHEELDFPIIVFGNVGKERLTVDGEWVEPGEYTVVEEADINSPEAQKAMHEFMRSPEVQKDIAQARRAVVEKRGRR